LGGCIVHGDGDGAVNWWRSWPLSSVAVSTNAPRSVRPNRPPLGDPGSQVGYMNAPQVAAVPGLGRDGMGAALADANES
jgi:hypothetical protein